MLCLNRTKIIWFFKSKFLSNIAGKKQTEYYKNKWALCFWYLILSLQVNFRVLQQEDGIDYKLGTNAIFAKSSISCTNSCPISCETWPSYQLVPVTYQSDSNEKNLEWKKKTIKTICVSILMWQSLYMFNWKYVSLCCTKSHIF